MITFGEYISGYYTEVHCIVEELGYIKLDYYEEAHHLFSDLREGWPLLRVVLGAVQNHLIATLNTEIYKSSSHTAY